VEKPFETEQPGMTRRDLLKIVTAAGVGLATTQVPGTLAATHVNEKSVSTPSRRSSMVGVHFEPRDPVRLGIIGVGLRGTEVLSEFLAIDRVEIRAVCDVIKDKCVRAAQTIEAQGQKSPELYYEGEHDFEHLCQREDLDFIYIATPWEWHVPQALCGLRNGKHVGTEVPAAYTIEDCWKIVHASELARRHCVLMENCCYDHAELMVHNMIRAGLLGELVHGECAYNHDLRKILFERANEGLWRRRHHVTRNGNLYPTHGFGPMARYMGINRDDRCEYLVSVSSAHLGLEEYRKDTIAANEPEWKETYRCGDYNTTIIRTAKGRSILLQHNVSSPRPYDRINLIQGTKGIFRDYPPRIYLDDGAGKEAWRALDEYRDKFEPELWKEHGETARKIGGHGGMDYIMCRRLIQCIREGLAPDIDVYDAATWSVAGPLSEESVAKRSAAVNFPDFIGGN
jgi:predicted dehydrogenase